jgi:small GTP-binding protein
MKAKVVLIGDSGVGKTSLLHCLCSSKRITDGHVERATIGGSQFKKEFMVSGNSVLLDIWDTAGSDKFANIVPMFFKGAAVGVLCFSVTSRQSFDNLSRWIERVLRESANMELFLVGTKVDRETEREVTIQEAQTFAINHHMVGYHETSAVTGAGIEDCFMTIAGCGNVMESVVDDHRPAPKITVPGEIPRRSTRC